MADEKPEPVPSPAPAPQPVPGPVNFVPPPSRGSANGQGFSDIAGMMTVGALLLAGGGYFIYRSWRKK